MVSGTSKMDLVDQMKVADPEMFHSMVKMHLSFILDLQTDECDCSFLYETKQDKQNRMKKAFTPMKKKSIKGVMDGAPLTQEGVCQIYQIIEYLGRDHNITCEGIFRKHGNLKKQQALKERLNRAVSLNLDEDEFSVHECAGVLKNFLSSLPEPLLTDPYYRAHCQIPRLSKESQSEEEREVARKKQISALQLLFQLIPEVNHSLLKELLSLLHKVSLHHPQNKMTARNLGTIFSTHILCPKKLAPEELQSKHQLLADAAAFMIEHAASLFDLPDKLLMDIEVHLLKKKNMFLTPKPQTRKNGLVTSGKDGSPVVNTVFSFVDREASKPQANATDQALAALYAHVQSMPESAQKRRLVEKLNQANGTGTPEVATSGSVRTVGRRHRRKTGDGFMNLLTPRRKRGAHGSYNLNHASHCATNQTLEVPSVHPKTPRTRSSPALLSPRARLPTPPHSHPHGHHQPATTPVSQASDVVAIDEVDTPGRESEEGSVGSDFDDSVHSVSDDSLCTEDYLVSTGEHEGSFLAPPLPPRTPAPVVAPPARTPLTSRTCDQSPLSDMKQSLSGRMLEAALTPRSRAPVMVCSVSQLQKWDNIVESSQESAQSHQIVQNENLVNREGGSKSKDEKLAAAQELRLNCDSHLPEEEYPRRKDSCRTRSLSSEFKEYLAAQGMDVMNSDDSSLEDSVLSDGGDADTSYSSDVRRLLNQQHVLSPSMQVIMDGRSPSALTDEGCAPPRRKSPRLSSTSSVSSLNSQTSINSQSSVSTIKAADSSIQEETSSTDENADPNISTRSKTRKRRSITELGPDVVKPAASAKRGHSLNELSGQD